MKCPECGAVMIIGSRYAWCSNDDCQFVEFAGEVVANEESEVEQARKTKMEGESRP